MQFLLNNDKGLNSIILKEEHTLDNMSLFVKLLWETEFKKNIIYCYEDSVQDSVKRWSGVFALVYNLGNKTDKPHICQFYDTSINNHTF